MQLWNTTECLLCWFSSLCFFSWGGYAFLCHYFGAFFLPIFLFSEGKHRRHARLEYFSPSTGILTVFILHKLTKTPETFYIEAVEFCFVVGTFFSTLLPTVLWYFACVSTSSYKWHYHTQNIFMEILLLGRLDSGLCMIYQILKQRFVFKVSFLFWMWNF